MSGTLRKKKENAASNVNALALEISKEPVVHSTATPRPSNFLRAAEAGNEKGIELMLRLTKGQVATTWKKKKGAFSTAKSERGGRRKSKRKTRRRKRKKRKKSRKKRGGNLKTDDCPICMESMKTKPGIYPSDNPPVDVHDGKKAVPHYFHKKCIEKVRNNKCPLCRQPMEIRHGQNTDNALQPPVLRNRYIQERQRRIDAQNAFLMDTHGYYTQDTGESNWAGNHTIYETEDLPCCSNCQKQSFCSRIFGCGQDLCHTCNENLQPTTTLKRCRKVTRGGRRKKKHRKTKRRKR